MSLDTHDRQFSSVVAASQEEDVLCLWEPCSVFTASIGFVVVHTCTDSWMCISKLTVLYIHFFPHVYYTLCM